jgi:hypothetical protein
MNHISTLKEVWGFSSELGAHARIFAIFVFFENKKLTVFILQNRGIFGCFRENILIPSCRHVLWLLDGVL